MKKLITLPLKFTDSLINKIDGVIIGIEGLSIGFASYETKDSVISKIKYIKNLKREVFVSLNKNIYNSDLKYLKDIIDLIKDEDIDGIIYYDISIYNIVKNIDSNIPLYWNQEHLTTNYMTCDFWKKRGVVGTFLSSDITIDEILDIKKKTNMKYIVQIFGYVRMMASSRRLITNYLEHIDYDESHKTYEVYERVSKRKYPIIEDNNGTITLSNSCMNGIKYLELLEKSGIDYIFLDSLNVPDFELVIDAFNNNDISYFDNIEDYFLSRKTIYKVKR